MQSKVFTHKTTGTTETQITIMEINQYREATEQETKEHFEKKEIIKNNIELNRIPTINRNI